MFGRMVANMRDLLARLYQTKMILFSLTMTVAGVLLIVLAQQVGAWDIPGWVKLVPYGEIGGILIGASLLSIWLDRLFRREQEATDDLRLRKVLKDQAPVMRDAVLDAFAANDEDLTRVATPETLDRLVQNSLALRLDDQQFAAEIFTDIRDQAINAVERWHDLTLHINLTPLPATKTRPAYFTVTVRTEYTTTPHHQQRRFICLSDRREYNELSKTHGDTTAWYLKPRGDFDAGHRQSFELLQFSVDGQQRTIRRTSRSHSQTYTSTVGTDIVKAAKPVTISYTYRTITPQHGHLLFFDIEKPTRDLNITLDYTGTDIATISAIDLVPSVRPTRTEHSPPQIPTKTIRLEIDGWTFPRSGIAFIWVLESESSPSGEKVNR